MTNRRHDIDSMIWVAVTLRAFGLARYSNNTVVIYDFAVTHPCEESSFHSPHRQASAPVDLVSKDLSVKLSMPGGHCGRKIGCFIKSPTYVFNHHNVP